MEDNQILNQADVTDVVTADTNSNTNVEINFSKVLEWGLYLIGVVLIIISIRLYFKDLDLKYDGNIYNFKEESYVGGDAYNYIISAARSTAVMVKSLIMAVLGSSAIITGRLSALINVKKNESK